jgi:hypothetical protein
VALAQEPLTVSEKEVVNYAFATQLGSGVYSVDGRIIQVYRIPLSYTVRAEAANRWGLRVTFPMTVGIYDFRSVDVLENGIPEHMDTASLVPGVEFRLPLLPSWLLKPYVEAGVGKDHSGAADCRIGGGGVRSIADFHPGEFDLTLGNSLVYARVDPNGAAPADDLLLFETSLEAGLGLGRIRGRRTEISFYGTVDLQRDHLRYPTSGGESPGAVEQYEVGVTFGPREEVRLWKIPIPHFGIGWRFGEDLAAFRLVIGIPSRSLQR